MRHRFKITWLIALLLSVYPNLASAAPLCADLFEISRVEPSQNEKLQTAVADIPLQNQELIAHHPISTFAQSLHKPLRFNFFNIGQAKMNDTIERGQKGESLQTRYVRKAVNSTFKTSPTKALDVDLNIRDITELGDADYANKSLNDAKTLPMHIIKPVTKWNTGFNSRTEARKAFKIPAERKIVHLYIRSAFNAKGRTLERQGLQRFIKELREAELFDVVIVSLGFGSKLFHDGEILRHRLPDVNYLDDNLADLLQNQTFGAVPPGSVIFNETVGMMPTIHQVSNLAIVAGAINFYEPAQVGTPTIAYRLRAGQNGGGNGVDPLQREEYKAETKALTKQLSWFQYKTFDNRYPYEIGKIYHQLSDPQGNPEVYYRTNFYKDKFNSFLDLLMKKVSAQLTDTATSGD